ncbi:MAG: acyltransferase [Pseudomonadota bacterium]|nr:acyltransferase [Pseudomonadota bacterium]
MEGMRGFAVFLVFLVHFLTLAAPWIAPDSALSGVTDAIRKIGNIGVDLFFVLSGYLIYGSLISRQQPFLAFMRRRVVRIYPTFCVVFAIYLYLSFLRPQESRMPPDAYDAWIYTLQNLALLPGIFPITPFITVAWSLSYEMFFYLAIPAMMLLLDLRARSAQWRIRLFFALGVAILVGCSLFGGPVRLIMFITGILLHEALRSGKIVPPRDGIAVLALLAGVLVNAVPFALNSVGAGKLTIVALSFFITCYSCFRGQSATLQRAFGWTPLRWLGNMSYSYYLVHGLTLKAAFVILAKLPPPAAHGLLFLGGLLPLMFAVTLISSGVLFLLVERPLSLKVSPRIVAA